MHRIYASCGTAHAQVKGAGKPPTGGTTLSLKLAKDTAIQEMVQEAEAQGANAVVGIDLDYETIQVGQGNMLMVSASGTAVFFENEL